MRDTVQADILKEDQEQNTSIFSTDFAPNPSFFFSNGMDPEYSVIGLVARRSWAMKIKYGANERSQKLRYHIQTSGRSLHTNANDEAITMPTEEEKQGRSSACATSWPAMPARR